MKRIIIILPASKREDANDWCVETFGEDARGTFDPGLNKSGNPNNPDTHCICNWQMSNDDYATIAAAFSAPGWSSKIAEGMPALDAPTNGKTNHAIFSGLHGLKGINGRSNEVG